MGHLKGKSEIGFCIHSVPIKFPVYEALQCPTKLYFLTFPRKTTKQFCFSRVLTDIVAKCHEEQLDHSVQSYIKVQSCHLDPGSIPLCCVIVSFPVCSRWDLSPFNWMGPTTIISSIPLSYLEFHLFALMVKTYYLNV